MSSRNFNISSLPPPRWTDADESFTPPEIFRPQPPKKDAETQVNLGCCNCSSKPEILIPNSSSIVDFKQQKAVPQVSPTVFPGDFEESSSFETKLKRINQPKKCALNMTSSSESVSSGRKRADFKRYPTISLSTGKIMKPAPSDAMLSCPSNEPASFAKSTTQEDDTSKVIRKSASFFLENNGPGQPTDGFVNKPGAWECKTTNVGGNCVLSSEQKVPIYLDPNQKKLTSLIETIEISSSDDLVVCLENDERVVEAVLDKKINFFIYFYFGGQLFTGNYEIQPYEQLHYSAQTYQLHE